MASNFNDPEFLSGDAASSSPDSLVAPTADASAPAAQPAAPASGAVIRFRSCRWYQPPENGNTEFCTHREVKPYAGTAGFDADAWCPDCQHYKLRRAPKKRNPDEYSY